VAKISIAAAIWIAICANISKATWPKGGGCVVKSFPVPFVAKNSTSAAIWMAIFANISKATWPKGGGCVVKSFPVPFVAKKIYLSSHLDRHLREHF
jgi:hypothetical protein